MICNTAGSIVAVAALEEVVYKLLTDSGSNEEKQRAIQYCTDHAEQLSSVSVHVLSHLRSLYRYVLLLQLCFQCLHVCMLLFAALHLMSVMCIYMLACCVLSCKPPYLH